MPRVHVLNQYIWPDAAPTSIYAEHLAARLARDGNEVCLVGGQGAYRKLNREKPPVSLRLLDHFQGRRGNLVETIREYRSINAAFRQYIRGEVRSGEVVIVSSAPPNSVWLAGEIHRRGARSIYWLQDYYPELVRGVREYPVWLRHQFRRLWDQALSRWQRVVKIGANLGGPVENSVVIRNWPTLDFADLVETEHATPGTVLYSGNLGYGHDVSLLVQTCEELREKNYRICIQADGPGVSQLPGWLKAQALATDIQELRHLLRQNEIHLVAAHPKIQEAVFPSKIWNCIAAGGQIIGSGFTAKMQTELEATLAAPHATHLDQWVELVRSAPAFSKT